MIEHFDDIGFTVITETPSSAFLDFKVYEIIHTDESGKRFYEEKDAVSVLPGTDDLDRAITYVNGFIKFDGCSHFYFGDPDNEGYIHLCGGDAYERHHKIIDMLYDMAKETIEGFCG